MSTKDSTKALSDAVAELDAAREAARLKLHLLSMDARGAWDDLENKFLTLKSDVERQGEEAISSSAVAARDLARSIRKFVEKHL